MRTGPVRWARAALGLVAASTLLGVPAGPADPAAAQTATSGTLGGVQGRASATGISATYNLGGILPIASPVDLSSPDALATIASGPSTFARASTADPGDLLANPDAVLVLGSPDYPQGSVPPYPYRVSASSGTGEPSSEVTPAPGLHARVAADQRGSTARATMPFLAAPAVATAGSVVADASTTTDGSTVTVHARSQVSGFDLLGLLTIESVVSDVTSTSDGVETTFSGGTTITGATLAGQPVTIDASGVHADGPSGPSQPSLLADLLGSGGGSLDEVLAGAGLRITLLGPVVQDAGTAGQLTAAGLRIEFSPTDQMIEVLGQLASLVPPTDLPLAEDLLALLQARHLVAIDVARGFVSLSARARPALTTPSRPTTGVAPAPNAGSLVGSVTPRTPVATPAASVGGPAAAPVGTTPATATTSLATGVGALAVLALLAQPFAGARLAKLAGTLLAPGAAGSCPLEER